MTAVAMTGHAPIGADVLTRAEAIALSDCEERIERGKKVFIEVGMALAAIREHRLYRAQFDTFEEYCATRWDFTGRRGRQLIEAAEIGNIFPVANSQQANALAAVPEAERAEVLAEATERGGGKPTAKKIAEVARERTAPKPAPVPELTPDVLAALAAAGPNGMTAWQLAFLISPAGPDAERAELTLRLAPILERLAAEGSARVAGEVDGGLLWALAEPEPPETPEPTADPSAAQVGSGPTPGSVGAVDPPADPGSTSPEPECCDPGPYCDDLPGCAAVEPETCLGTDMDCGRSLPCPNHPRTPEERIAAVAAVAPEFAQPAPVEPKPTLTLVPTEDEKRAAEQRDARALLRRIVELAAPASWNDGHVSTWIKRMGAYDDELAELTKQATAAIAVLDRVIEEAGR